MKSFELKIPALRQSCYTGEIKLVDISIYLTYHRSLEEWYVHIRDGVTGHESAPMKFFQPARQSWTACAGTKDRWDRLEVPLMSMELIQEWLETRNVDA